MKHVEVFRRPNRFAGWPANYGIWNWDGEIAVGFQSGTFKVVGAGNHAIDNAQPRTIHQARSTDGGESWVVSEPEPFNGGEGLRGELKRSTGPMAMDSPGFGLTCRDSRADVGSFLIHHTTDRGLHWSSPSKVQIFEKRGIDARTDYIVRSGSECMLFLTARKDDGKEGRVFCIRSTDGGQSWDWVGWICGDTAGYRIMPSSVQLRDGTIITAVRWQEERGGSPFWGIDIYRSSDGGARWKRITTAVGGAGLSNPPSMIALQDGRMCLTYGYRSPPYGIRARLSQDDGANWGPEITLREDAGNWDIGYPRTIQRPDGKLVSVYYYNDSAESERYIAASIWTA